MTTTVELPLWLVVLALMLAAIAALDRVLMPSARWFLRRRMERLVARLQTLGAVLKLPPGGLDAALTRGLTALEARGIVRSGPLGLEPEPAMAALLAFYAAPVLQRLEAGMETQPMQVPEVATETRTRGEDFIFTILNLFCRPVMSPLTRAHGVPARNRMITMTLDRTVLLFAGTMILLSVALTVWVSPLFVWLTLFVGANLIQSALTGFCPAAALFSKLGVKTGCAFR